MTDTVIIGAGLSGLIVAQKLKSRGYGHTFLLLEKAQKTGGVIRTCDQEGFIAEAGPHGFLDNCRQSREILAETGLDTECLKAPLGRFVRYVYLGGKLQQIPQTPRAILTTSLICWKDKLRILADLWKKPLAGQPSVAQWAEHRFGPALLPFVDAALTGTYAGDMERLAIDGVMPGVRAVEKRHGSVIRGLLAGKRRNSGGRRLPAMTSFPKGMQRLPDRLTEFLRPDVDLILGCEALKIRKLENSWAIDSEKGTFAAANLVLALPINTSLALLKDIDEDMPLSQIPEARITTVALGFDKEVRLPPGFGYLIPDSEGRFTLGTLFSSNMFPGRAPGDCSLIEVLVGGRRHPERAESDDQSLIDHALRDIRDILDITRQPIHTKILRNGSGIPQPEQGYTDLLAWRNCLTDKHRGLFICGFGWDGIGINDMIKTAGRVADSIMAGQYEQAGAAAVKGVYF
jgi:protoporphyrinogen/coproporphyrinogen III oxidase